MPRSAQTRGGRRSELGRSCRALLPSGLRRFGGLAGNGLILCRPVIKPLGSATPLAVFAVVLDLHAAGQRGVDGAVAVAGQVDSPLHHLLVGLAVPGAAKGDLDLGERLGPLLLALFLDLDFERAEGLLVPPAP